MADTGEREEPGTAPGSGRGRGTRRVGGQDSPSGEPGAGDGGLAWSVAAMSDALRRLAGARAADMPQAVAAATEAVWWVTAVDAAMVRHHPAEYGRALAALDPAARRAVERSFAGFRFIRGQLGYSADPGDFIQRQPSGRAPALAWTWRDLPPPPPQRGTARETSPYREYRAQLAGRPLTEALTRTADFLSQAHAATRTGQRSPASTM
jgi:hypothetical protein